MLHRFPKKLQKLSLRLRGTLETISEGTPEDIVKKTTGEIIARIAEWIPMPTPEGSSVYS